MYNPAPHVPWGKDQGSALLGWALGPVQGETFSEPWPRLYDGWLGLSTAGVVAVTAPVLGSSGREVTSGWTSDAQATDDPGGTRSVYLGPLQGPAPRQEGGMPWPPGHVHLEGSAGQLGPRGRGGASPTQSTRQATARSWG